MDLLRDWLAPTFRREVSEALRWKKRDLGEEEDFSGPTERYSDDGSNIRIQGPTSGVVQISKFLEFGEPIKATVTDKHTRVNARFSIDATREYQKQNRKPFTKDKTGGLIQMLDFELVATHIGPRIDRLTLYVRRFKSLGSDGSAILDVPRPIESPDKGCLPLLDVLKEIREQEKLASSQGSSTRESSVESSSIQSQAAPPTSNEESPDSQSFLMTQVPFVKKIKLEPEQSAGTYDLHEHKKRSAGNAVLARVEIKQSRNVGSDSATHEVHEPIACDASHGITSADLLRENDGDISSTPNRKGTTTNISGASKTTPHIDEEPDRPTKKRKLNHRITSRDVIIPKDQETLLSRQDSWLPAEPGQKDPRANIPIALLQMFNEEADSRQKGLVHAREDPPDDLIIDHDDDSTGALASESESDIDSAQWPASPDRNQLPPDSSPPDIDPPDREISDSGPAKSPGEPQDSDNVLPKEVPLSSKDTENVYSGNNNTHSSENGVAPTIDLVSSSANGPMQRTPEEASRNHTEGANYSTQSFHHTLENEVHLNDTSKSQNHTDYGGPPSPELGPSSDSLSDSEIEMTVPTSLHKPTEAAEATSSRASYPSTAPYAKGSFTQVKRTPYAEAGQGYRHRSFMNGRQFKTAEDKQPVKGMSQEGNTQIPCTTSTMASNPEDYLPSSHLTSKGIQDLNHPSHVKTSDEKSVSNHSSYAADTKSLGECGSLSLQSSLPAKRLIEDDEFLLHEGANSKRLKTNTDFSHAESSRPRETSAASPLLDTTNCESLLIEPTTSPFRNGSGVPAIEKKVEVEPRWVSNSLSEHGNSIESQNSDKLRIENINEVQNGEKHILLDFDSTKTAPPEVEDDSRNTSSGTFTAQTDELSLDKSEGWRTQQVPVEIVVGHPDASAPKDQSHSPTSKTTDAARTRSARESVPLHTVSHDRADADMSPKAAVREHQVSPRPSKIHVEDRIPTHELSNAATNHRPEFRVPEPIQAANVSTDAALLDRFRSAYPGYGGDLKHFCSLCRKIERLWKQGRLHKSLWDDFVIRSKIEYADHIRQCMEDGEDPVPYETFYDEKIDEPIFRKKILNPLNLVMASNGDSSRSVTSHATSMESTPSKGRLRSFFSDEVVQVANGLHTDSTSPITIDLTKDDEVEIKTEQVEIEQSPSSKSSARRPLPWLVDSNRPIPRNSGSSNATPTKQRRLPKAPKAELTKQPTKEPTKEVTKYSFKDARSANKQPEFSVSSGRARSQKVHTKAQKDDAPEGANQEPEDSSWWKDDNTPFKKFTEDYLGICPSRGNAYATPEDKERGKREQRRRNRTRAMKDFDFLNWKI